MMGPSQPESQFLPVDTNRQVILCQLRLPLRLLRRPDVIRKTLHVSPGSLKIKCYVHPLVSLPRTLSITWRLDSSCVRKGESKEVGREGMKEGRKVGREKGKGERKETEIDCVSFTLA